MTSKVPDFNNNELILIRATLRERFGREIPLQMADTELRLNLASTEITSCPTAYWEVDNCHYLISKIDKSHFHATFYYRLYQQYGTQKKRYDDLFDCIVSLLKAQEQQAQKELGANT
jgi:hypothetical protein